MRNRVAVAKLERIISMQKIFIKPEIKELSFPVPSLLKNIIGMMSTTQSGIITKKETTYPMAMPRPTIAEKRNIHSFIAFLRKGFGVIFWYALI